MADPVTLTTLATWAAQNPEISIPVATTAYRFFFPDKQKELMNEVLESQTNFRDMLARHAYGNFTATEREQIQAAAEPQVNQIAGGVAARGLGTSGAGAQVIAQAQQAPIQQAQRNALQALPAADANLLQATQLLDDGSFMEDITAIAGLLAKKRGRSDEVNDAIGIIFNSTMGQGYSIPRQDSFNQQGDLQYGGGRI